MTGLAERLRSADEQADVALIERPSERCCHSRRDGTSQRPHLPGGVRITESLGGREVVQDVFLTLFRKIDTFEGRAALGTWLYRVATNAALIKRRGKRVELEMSLEDCLPTFRDDGHREGDRAMLVADWSGTPESALLSGEAREILEQALERLPEHYRGP
jgi:RNA polymerase sigma factor (sigma-70 family)